MQVVSYIKSNGLEKLQRELFLDISDYPDRVVINYNQIESPRFNPIADECRALILRKGTWDILARSFDRFYNFGEGEELREWKLNEKSVIQEKLDGSLMSLYYDGERWCVSTRKKAFAEGQTTYGRTFSEIFWQVIRNKVQFNILDHLERNVTYVFELIGPENRIVSRYEHPDIVLIGMRDNLDGREYTNDIINNVAKDYNLRRPNTASAHSLEEVQKLSNTLPALDEGFVVVWENPVDHNGSHYRIKFKNSAYLAIAHMRNNGIISPKHVLKLIMLNEHIEYLRYFEEDLPIFQAVQSEFERFVLNAKSVYDECRSLESQKDFALAIQKKLTNRAALGALFLSRKNGSDVEFNIRQMDPDKLVESLGIKDVLTRRELLKNT